jgi:hypothetical protein
MDVNGRHVTVDDPEVIAMVTALLDFPAQLFREANNRITEIILKYTIEGSVITDTNQPFAALLYLQQNFTWNLMKICMDSVEQIRNQVREAEILPLTNRQDVAKFQQEAEFVLSMQEKSRLLPKGYGDQNFWYNTVSAWELKEENLPEPSKTRALRTAGKLLAQLDQGLVSRQYVLECIRDTFKVKLNETSQADQDEGHPPLTPITQYRL